MGFHVIRKRGIFFLGLVIALWELRNVFFGMRPMF